MLQEWRTDISNLQLTTRYRSDPIAFNDQSKETKTRDWISNRNVSRSETSAINRINRRSLVNYGKRSSAHRSRITKLRTAAQREAQLDRPARPLLSLPPLKDTRTLVSWISCIPRPSNPQPSSILTHQSYPSNFNRTLANRITHSPRPRSHPIPSFRKLINPNDSSFFILSCRSPLNHIQGET
jgi:hypothetical protein